MSEVKFVAGQKYTRNAPYLDTCEIVAYLKEPENFLYSGDRLLILITTKAGKSYHDIWDAESFSKCWSRPFFEQGKKYVQLGYRDVWDCVALRGSKALLVRDNLDQTRWSTNFELYKEYTEL